MKIMGTIVGILALISAIWVIYQVWVVDKNISAGGKIIWTLAALFFSIVTAIAYLIVRKS